MIEGQDKTTITRQPSQPQSTHNHYHPAHRTRDKDNELDDSGCVLTVVVMVVLSCPSIGLVLISFGPIEGQDKTTVT